MMKINNIVKLILCGLFVALLACDLNSSKSETRKSHYCSEKYGCLNAQFIEIFEKKCTDKNKGCYFSFEDFFGDLDKIYFVQKWSINFEDCKIIPIPEGLKADGAELCQFIILEKNKKCRGYLRGYCASEITRWITENKLGFDPEKTDLVSIMNPNEKILIQRIDEPETIPFYYIVPQKSKLTRFRDDDCIGLP